jgi:hypothetical protein
MWSALFQIQFSGKRAVNRCVTGVQMFIRIKIRERTQKQKRSKPHGDWDTALYKEIFIKVLLF